MAKHLESIKEKVQCAVIYSVYLPMMVTCFARSFLENMDRVKQVLMQLDMNMLKDTITG